MGHDTSGIAAPSRLDERCLIKVSGGEATDFLQNLLTQDVAKLEEGALVYGCLLTPQGRFLHDLFIFKDGGAYYLDCERGRRDDLIRRLNMFRLRAKVVIEDQAESFYVYAGESAGKYSFADPRLAALGGRFYLPTAEAIGALPASVHKDRRIHLGVPEGSIDIRPDVDITADVNLDLLNAIDWNKGCFVGQEVTARVNWRGLVKRRLVIVKGAGLTPAESLLHEGRAVGEIRSVNTAGTEALALLRLDALEFPLLRAGGASVTVHRQDWLKIAIKTST